jgi:hypothetical protein
MVETTAPCKIRMSLMFIFFFILSLLRKNLVL